MKRKILVTLLAFCLIASLCVVGAAARDPISQGTADDDCEEPCNHVAAIGSTHYEDLEYAITQADDDDTIDILRDVTDGRGVVVSSGKNITIDFHDFTYTVTKDPAGSNNTQHQCFQLLRDSTITMKDGTIVANEPTINIIVQNYSNLTLDGMTLDASVGDNNLIGSYVLSNNCGNVVITGNTNITANNGFAFDAYYWPGNTYPEGVTVTIDKNFTGTITGDIEATRDSTDTNTGNSTINIEAGTVNGDITCASNGKVSISNATVNGDITNSSKVGGVLVIDDALIRGTVANSDTSATTTVTGSTVTGEVTGAVVIDSTVAGVLTNTAPKDVVAIVDGKHYKTLQAAINAAESGDTVTLVANVDEDIAAGTPLKVKKDITIEGRSKTISLTLKGSALDSGRDKILQVKGENAKLTLNNVTLDIDGFVNTANEDRVCGDAIDLYLGGDLEANNSTIDIDNVAAAFVIQTAGETIELNNTTVTADNVRGNGSQGGEWTVNNSSIRFTNCGDNAFSVETATINSSDVVVNGSGLCGIMGADISIINGSTVTVTGSGKKLPQKSIYAPNGDAYNYAVELKKNGELKVEDSTLTLSGNVNENGAAIDNIFVSAGTTTDTANGTVNAGFVVAEGSDQLVVRMMDGNVQYSNQTVTKGDSVYLPTLSKSGYTFTGWRVNNSNTIVRGGESYPITANTTFTAVWNMIMIPDTYDIAVDQPAHGTVDVSFSNASQGSVITVTATPDEGYELVYITVDGEPISGNSFVMPDHAVEVSALFAEIGKEVNFVDVSRADWFYDYVQYVAQNGLMEGTTRTAFEPNASMTRAMFWTVLARIDGETITGDAWKTLAQTWAVESGISDGTNADALITREQMVTMLYRYAGSPVTGGMAVSEFTDGVSVSDYATDAVTWALSEGILTGMGDGILAPQGTATRAQAAAMLMRFVEA